MLKFSGAGHFTNSDCVNPLLPEQAEKVQTVQEESRSQGDIGLKVYAKYLSSGANVVVLVVVLFINILAQVRWKPGWGR